MRKTVRMESARKRTGRIIKARREQLGFTSQKALAEAGNMGVRMVAAAELGEHVGPKTLRRLETALKWAPGHLDEVLQGGEPDQAPPVTREIPSVNRTDVRYYEAVTDTVDDRAVIERMIELLPSIRRRHGATAAERIRREIITLAEDAGLIDFASSELASQDEHRHRIG